MSNDLQAYFAGETERWGKRFTDPQYPIEAQKEMEQTINEFKGFADAFLDHFEKKGNRPLMPLPALDERIKSVLLEYWIPLSIVAAQYQVTEYRKRLNRVTEDVLTQLKDNAQKNANIEIADVLVYINKRPLSYFYPFTNRSFVALSWFDDEILEKTSQNLINSDKVMALPHELGHHVYWNSDFGLTTEMQRDILGSRLNLSGIAKDLSEKIPDIPPEQQNAIDVAIQSWTEEIFADVIGALISINGEQFALSAQNLALRYCAFDEDKVYNDGCHPVPLLRPLIAARALRWRKDNQNMDRPAVAIDPKYTVKVEVGQTIVEVKIEYLKSALELTVDKVCTNIQLKGIKPAGPSKRISNFDELKEFAEQEKSVNGIEIYDTLLSTLIFESGLISGKCNKCGKSATVKCPNCGK